MSPRQVHSYSMITVHAGLHKTASTSIQEYFSHLPRHLRRKFHYVPAGDFLGKHGFQVPGGSGKSESELIKALARDRHVVISHESFLGNPWDGMYRFAQERVAEMARYFAGQSEFQVVVYLRPQHQWVESVYKTCIQDGMRVSATDFVVQLLDTSHIRYSALVDGLLEVIGPESLVVRPFHRDINAVEDFLEVIGAVETRGADYLPRYNVSISPMQTEILRHVNEFGSNEVPNWVRAWFFQHFVRPEEELEMSVLPEGLQERLFRLTREDWRSLGEIGRRTGIAQTEAFDRAADSADQVTVRPYVGASEYREEVLVTASKAIANAIPVVFEQQNTIEARLLRRISKGRKSSSA